MTTRALTEKDLISACRSGDPSAQRELYERFAPRMFRVCLRYLKHEMEAEDVMTEGFVKVFRKLNSFEFRGEGSFSAWSTRIMVNESLMLLRKKSTLNLVEEEQAARLDSGKETDGELRAEDLYEMVRSLPDGYRTVFNMFAIEGFSHKEIADSLGISENTSKSQLRKARLALQVMVKKYGIVQ